MKFNKRNLLKALEDEDGSLLESLIDSSSSVYDFFKKFKWEPLGGLNKYFARTLIKILNNPKLRDKCFKFDSISVPVQFGEVAHLARVLHQFQPYGLLDVAKEQDAQLSIKKALFDEPLKKEESFIRSFTTTHSFRHLFEDSFQTYYDLIGPWLREVYEASLDYLTSHPTVFWVIIKNVQNLAVICSCYNKLMEFNETPVLHDYAARAVNLVLADDYEREWLLIGDDNRRLFAELVLRHGPMPASAKKAAFDSVITQSVKLIKARVETSDNLKFFREKKEDQPRHHHHHHHRHHHKPADPEQKATVGAKV